MSSSSSSSLLLADRELDVFLSFSAEIHLGNDFNYYLSRNGIKSFKSESWKEKNFELVDQQRILEALAETKVAVVMTSEKQSCSAGFLEELVVILEFQEKHSLTVIPIFLRDQPLDMEEAFQLFPERSQIWRAAITKLDNIAKHYWFSQKRVGMSDLDRIKKVAGDILLMFLSSTSSDFSGLVGMDRQMKAFRELLALETVKEVRTIGIWGKAGVGKTTLARNTFAEISVNFETHVYLENVGNEKDKLEGTNLMSLDHDGHDITEAKQKHRKTLLIADGVDNIEHGKWIAEHAKWFAQGSRVILISQDKDLLVEAGVEDVFEVRSLRYDEALQLFSYFAFKQPYPPSDFERLAVRAVELAGFLPLTLRLFGSFLTGRGLQEWEAALLKLNAKHGKDVWKLMEEAEDKNVVYASEKIKTK